MKAWFNALTDASVVVSGVPVGYCTCTKISPRSIDGMNSNPTTPSGISATAPIVSTAEIATTVFGCASPQVSGWSTYQPRNRVNPRVKSSMKPGGLHFESSDQLPASDGVIMNDTA